MGDTTCLNCGVVLQGPFCAACGQRALPPNPTVREIAADAWSELTGYDGRLVATLRGLLHPGFLTREYLSGRRARYVTPVRLYLVLSVLYFIVAAAAPQVDARVGDGVVTGPGGFSLQVDGDAWRAMSNEDRASLMEGLADAPWFVRPILHALAEDPEALRARMFVWMPRVFFALLPVFAVIVTLFYRKWNLPTGLVFATYTHAVGFILFTMSGAARFAPAPVVASVVDGIAVLTFVAYVVASLRAVFGGGWTRTVLKACAIGVTYLAVYLPAMLLLLLWVSRR